MVVDPHWLDVWHVTVTVAGTVNDGSCPFVHLYVMAELPVAVVELLGSMLLPELVFVMLSTGVAVNLQTPVMVALTVTVVLSLAWAEPAANMEATAADSSRRLRFRVLINCSLKFESGANRTNRGSR
jgi:hypothetical protein